MEITAAMVKELRDKTNAGMMDCKQALKDCDGDMEKSIDFLRQKGLATALKRAGRTASEGQVHSYIHGNGKLGVLIEVNSETDFVAKTDQFNEMVHNLAMHIAAANPVCLDRESLPEDVLSREKEIYHAQAVDTGKPENIVEKIVSGKIEKYFGEVCLMEQAYVKDPDKKIADLINETVASLGENIVIRRFMRYQLGEESQE